MNQNANILWQQCADILRDNLTPSVYSTWFAPLEVVNYENDTLILRVKSQFVAEYIEENYIDLLARSIRRVFGENTRLEYRVLIDSTSGAGATYPSRNPADMPVLPQTLKKAMPSAWESQLNESYTFDNFIAGETNKMARTAGNAIVKDPGKTIFNPLFIYGASGVGKTHLANAIGNAIVANRPDARVLYVGANTFKLQYQEAVQQNQLPNFLMFYQSVDVLILDDIQYFSGLKGTQDTFFHIFNYLHQSRKQLILTADCSPLQLHDVEERLLTRFKWGLSIEIQRPDMSLRRAILLDKMHRNGMEVSDDIVAFIAQTACRNVRDIEGVLASLMAYSTLMNKDIDLELTRTVVGRLVDIHPKQVLPADILGAVCEHSGMSEKAVTGQSRQKEVVRARQIMVYLCKRLTNISLNEIGTYLGHRNHATIIHTLNTTMEQLEYDGVLRHDIDLIERELTR